MSTSAPSLTFDKLQQIVTTTQYNLIPVYSTLHVDLETPVSAYIKLTGQQKYSFLLESVEGGEHQARYSYIGTLPYKLLKQDHIDPLIAIQHEIEQFHTMPCNELPAFTGGGIGYIGYDCIQYWEPKVRISNNNTLQLPDSIFMFCHDVCIFDHVKHTVLCVTHISIDRAQKYTTDQLHELYDAACQRLNIMTDKLQQPLPHQSSYTYNNNHNHIHNTNNNNQSVSNAYSYPCDDNLMSNMGQQTYESAVRTLQNHINIGDIIQAVPSHRCARTLNNDISAFDVYRSLRVVNPSPYMFYLDLDEFYIVGASPEQLVKVEANKRVSTHPIAGTRKRGATAEEDEWLENDLLADQKERAEHIMLVDLGRNDIGRIATPGSVQVESLMHIERYSHVMHIVSVVSGQLASDKSPYDAFRSVFPAGTLSGAPKIRAMQLISEIENDHRNVYGGAVGYISLYNVIDVAIAIRTLVVKNNVAYLQAGAGIVYDSVPVSEWDETMKKMGSLVKAINLAESTAQQLHQRNSSNTHIQYDLQNTVNEVCSIAKHHNIDIQQLQQLIQTQYNNTQ